MATKKQIWVLVLSGIAAALLDASVIYGWVSEEGFSTDSAALHALFLAGAGLLLALAVIALVTHNSQQLCNPVRERQAMLIIKAGLVPFFVLSGLVVLGFALFPGGIVLSIMLSAAGWLMMLAGSAWAVCYALSMRKPGMISGGVAALFIAMQFFFVLDVVAALVMFFLGRSREKAAQAGA